jgi:glycerophosphoryl diester phosphodiesterase
VEIKSPGAGRAAGLVRATAAVLKRHRRARLLVSSFDLSALLMMRLVAPEFSRGLLCANRQRKPMREGWAVPALGARAIHPERNLVDAARIHRWRRQRLDINVWTVDDVEEARRLAGLGVTGIITNRPGELRRELSWI